jgi:SagB-type dehydrogenase family enzyme
MEDEIRKRILLGRSFITKFGDEAGIPEDYETDQNLKKPQPPLTKAAMTDHPADLPTDFEKLQIDNDFLHVINSRKSQRVYTEEPVSLLTLSYLLWCAQGVKSIRGKAYATLRTVPSGGARHPFECYLALQKVEGLEDGLYHYLPMTHQIEFLGCPEDLRDFISRAVCDQKWAARANAVFFLSCVFYRAEWRYGIWAHAPILMDSGHVTENLYLAAASIGLGGCAIAAVDPPEADKGFGLDGEEETIFYAMPVGTVRKEDREAEDAIYAFVKEEGL